MTGEQQYLSLDVSGMTCASCARRIERKLNKAGFVAQVNYATERASIVAAENDAEYITQAIQVIQEAGYTAVESSDSVAQKPQKPWRLPGSAVLSVPVILISMVGQLQFNGWQWVVLGLSLPVIIWGGWPFHVAAYKALRHRGTTMDTLVSLGSLSALLWSLYALFVNGAGAIGMRMKITFFGHSYHELYFESACTVITFLLFGRYIEQRSRKSQMASLTLISRMMAKQASRVSDEVETAADLWRNGKLAKLNIQQIPASNLRIGDAVRVLPGEKIPCDGIVLAGISELEMAFLTGESVPQQVTAGDSVLGGAINGSGALLVQAIQVGDETQLARLTKLLENAQLTKPAVQRLADKVSGVFVPIVLGISALTFIGWLISGAQMASVISASVSTLIIACPCALGLATPTALIAGTTRGAKLGLMIRDALALESARRIDTVVFDKTGTLTEGRMRVQEYRAFGNITEQDVLGLVASLEQHSNHPVAKAIVAYVKEQNLQISSAVNVVTHPGLGVSGVINGQEIRAGKAEWLKMRTPDDLLGTVVAVSVDGEPVGIISLTDSVRQEAVESLQVLKSMGVEVIMLTGDNQATADYVAKQLGIETVYANTLPQDKMRIVAELEEAGRRVVMVGDGVNDTVAMSYATLGIAMHGGTDAANASADITILRDDLRSVPKALALSTATLKIIRQNLFWAFAYNTLAIPAAVFGLLSPVIAGIAMAFSSVFVVVNSLRLNRFNMK